jgi:hypothetical protein
MIAAIQFSKLRYLVVNTVNTSHHVGAWGCSRQKIWLSSSSWTWTNWW